MRPAVPTLRHLFWWLALLSAPAISCNLNAATAPPLDERIWIDAAINGKRVHLFFDTGASALILFPKAAERLHLSVTPPDTNAAIRPGEIYVGLTERCDFMLGDHTTRVALSVAEIPRMLPDTEDGIRGWGAVVSNIISIDALHQDVTVLEALPKSVRNWQRFRLDTNSSIVRFEIEASDGARENVAIDTGSPYGLRIPPKRWEAWKSSRPELPVTLVSYYTPGAGLVVARESWAREFPLGSLAVREMPLMEADKADMALGSTNYAATLGLWGLKRMDVVIDGIHGFVYIEPRNTSPPPYQHNRLGATFTPVDLEKGDDLLAKVMPRTPASDAGIRDGDALLKVGTLDVTRWRTDRRVLPLSRFWDSPAGTTLELTLKRDKVTWTTNAVLRDILKTKGR